ncbi:helix-turn-helix domain-containing protein [Halobacillus sp. Marseille-Q1614]|uniref:helix-turn-helix domain-containing protein n=1 Tax=Halobacillus sp. Marseille-Q1614 TaxID=2709134 RepID=UPI00156E2BBA|nr:helix-turn-helix transcriptional regulator [Halobacillus sp. Marseille-Q1614]
MNIDETVGANIKKYRKMRRMTQKELGDLIGVKHNTISQYEKGRNAPEPNMIFAIAKALEITVSDLFPETTKTMVNGLNDEQREFLCQVIEKAHALDEEGRKDFFKNIRFAVEYFDRND